MRKNIEKHNTKSRLYAMIDVKGITLTTLVITIVVLLILAGVATFTGVEAIENTKRTRFIAELKIMQSYVNQWYEDIKPGKDETWEGKTKNKFAGESLSENVRAIRITDEADTTTSYTSEERTQKIAQAKIALAAANVLTDNYDHFYLLEDNQKQALGVEGVSQSVLVSVQDRKVVSFLGLKYKNQMYYTIDSLDSENGIDAVYNVGYENPNKNRPSILVTGRSVYNGETVKGVKYKFTVDVTQGSKYINKGDLYYGKIENGEVKNWNKTEDKSFIVDREGTYKIYYKDAAGNKSEPPIEYKIEPKTTLISSSTINVYMKRLSGQEGAAVYTNNESITSFKLANQKPSSEFLKDTNLVKDISATGSKYPVYIWYDNGTIWYYSDDNWIGMNSYGGQFFECLKSISDIDLTILDTQNVTNMDYMFLDCNRLTKLDLSNFNTQNVTSMSNMFNGCNSLTSLDLSSFNTKNVTNMSSMFRACSKLTSLNVSSFDTSNVQYMNHMFYDCRILSELNINNFNTENVKAMNSMFINCKGLTNLNLSNFNTQNVTHMGNMFDGCSKLINLDLSSFNTEKVTSMTCMFYGCSSLTDLDVSSFNTISVKDMSHMFRACSKLVNLDVSSFDTSNVTNMYWMFYNNPLLEKIYASDNFKINLNAEGSNFNELFRACPKLVGGSGTKYNSSNTDGTYARIDDPSNGKPGYFTRKQNV